MLLISKEYNLTITRYTMSQDQSYYSSLIEQGYSETQALQHTQSHFPDFNPPAATPIIPYTEEGNVVENDSNEIIDTRSQYIPISKSKIKKALLERVQLEPNARRELENLFKMFEVIWHHDMHHDLEELKEGYESMNPDVHSDITYTQPELDSFLQTLDSAMIDGNWAPVTTQELDEALEGEDVLAISLDVRFDEFKEMKLYKLGFHHDEIEVSSMYGLKKETKTVKIFDKILTVLEFKGEDWFMEERKRKKHYLGDDGKGVHIRLFRDVPHLDMEVIFPNTSPSMRTLEKIKISAPLIGGVVSLGMKYIPILFGGNSGSTSLSLIGGILTALGTYVLKTYTSYQKTREKFRSMVAKDMYFKGLANNESVLTYIVDMAEEQEVKEAICAYMFVLQSTAPVNEEQVDDQIEQWLKQTFSIDIDFEVDDALEKLEKMNLLHVDANGFLSVEDVNSSLVIMDDYWDNLYDFVD
ncbi:MAG: hypothetical protein CMB10_01685 [Euryarchaeota archaeon]|nr:hypothetical protein [Euryarchaeota archaeon]